MNNDLRVYEYESSFFIEEKRKRDKLDALLNASELLNRFNEKKHLATCAKNRKKRKAKKRNR